MFLLWDCLSILEISDFSNLMGHFLFLSKFLMLLPSVQTFAFNIQQFYGMEVE